MRGAGGWEGGHGSKEGESFVCLLFKLGQLESSRGDAGGHVITQGCDGGGAEAERGIFNVGAEGGDDVVLDPCALRRGGSVETTNLDVRPVRIAAEGDGHLPEAVTPEHKCSRVVRLRDALPVLVGVTGIESSVVPAAVVQLGGVDALPQQVARVLSREAGGGVVVAVAGEKVTRVVPDERGAAGGDARVGA